jgi:hypothetical protein
MQTANGTLMETWLPMNDSVFAGQSTLRKKTTEVVSLEDIQLICRNREYFYIPAVAGQNEGRPVEFKVTAYSKNGFTAINEAHDFPKRIQYILLKKDSLHAIIDDGAKTPAKKQDYYFVRLKKTVPPKSVKKQ